MTLLMGKRYLSIFNLLLLYVALMLSVARSFVRFQTAALDARPGILFIYISQYFRSVKQIELLSEA